MLGKTDFRALSVTPPYRFSAPVTPIPQIFANTHTLTHAQHTHRQSSLRLKVMYPSDVQLTSPARFASLTSHLSPTQQRPLPSPLAAPG